MTRANRKMRADELLVANGHAVSRARAKAMILAGDVRIGDRVIDRPAELLDADTSFDVALPPKYVSRGGFKLEHALKVFSIDASGKIAADFGASTGGFSDCLLQHGARKVYAVDVGYGQLHFRLRQDSRVTVMERTNVRYLEALPETVDIVVIDVSFISLDHILPIASRVLTSGGEVIALIKPQFEAGKDRVDRRGVVRDELVRREVVENAIAVAGTHRLGLVGVARSPLVGPAGNEEFLAYFRKDAEPADPAEHLDVVFRG